MVKQTIKFEVLTDYFHTEPSARFYKILLNSIKETESNLNVEFSYETKLRPSKYFLTRNIGGLIYLLESFVNTKIGETKSVSFESFVSEDYLEEFKKKVEDSSLRYIE